MRRNEQFQHFIVFYINKGFLRDEYTFIKCTFIPPTQLPIKTAII